MQGDIPAFSKRAPSSAEACVYMWASPTTTTDEFDPLYVGKAGYGVARRLQQHRSGFVHSGSGRSNCALIADWLRGGRSIAVFTRIASTSEMFGVRVSLYSSEEEALCDAFAPRWNRASFPGAKTTKVEPQAIQTVPQAMPQFVAADVTHLAHGDEIAAFLDSLSDEKRSLFQQLAGLVEQRFPDKAQKLVRGYSNQPTGYNNTPMLVFADIGSSGRAVGNGWVARIPLVDETRAPLTILFPSSAKRLDLDPTVISEGQHGAWRPLDIAAFLHAPDIYLR
jgi:hypothetical protein